MTSRNSTPRRVALYARLSVTTEESVSVERQLDAGRKYAAARGWTVVAEAIDDGVSATKNRPEDRVGWREILDHPETFEAVVVWKVDRLARRVLDFLHADEALRARGAGLVAVEDPIDMTTPQGRAFATMLAVFAEMEAASISARVRAARRTIVASGRRAGGRTPFGWMNVPNPDGPGMVLAQDPERIGVVEDLARRALAGESLYSLARSLERDGVTPRARGQRKDATRWHEASVETILRAPVLAGMTPYTPGRVPGEKAATDVLRDADGLPVIDESVAILTTEERRRLLATLDAAKRPGTRQKAGHAPALLYGLARCGSCDGLMYRATAAGKYRQYRCQQKGCPRHVGIARDAVEAHVVEEFLRVAGPLPVILVEEVEAEESGPLLAEVEHAIAETQARMDETEDADEEARLFERLRALKAARRTARAEAVAKPEIRTRATGETFEEAWSRTSQEDVEERRGLLLAALDAVEIAPGGGRGRAFDGSRVSLRWRDDRTEDYGPGESSGPAA
jgi:DNA invertase Pin-like site-specific DNA recombinase